MIELPVSILTKELEYL